MSIQYSRPLGIRAYSVLVVFDHWIGDMFFWGQTEICDVPMSKNASLGAELSESCSERNWHATVFPSGETQ